MNLTKKAALFGAVTLAALGLAAAQPAQAQATQDGAVNVVTDSTGTYWQLTSDSTISYDPNGGPTNSYGGVYITYSGDAASLTNLTATYQNAGSAVGAGSPRFILVDPSGYAVADYPPYADLNTNSKVTTTNLVGSSYSGIDNDSFGGAYQSNTITYPDFLNMGSNATHPIGFIELLLDGGSYDTTTQVNNVQKLDVYSFTVNGTTYAPNGPAPVPEPASWAAFAFMGLGAAALMFKARKRKGLTA